MKANDNKTLDQTYLIGAALIFVGSLLYSSKAVIVKLAYRYGIDSTSLLALRMLFALPVYFAVIFWVMRNKKQEKKYGKIDFRDWIYMILLGIFGYYLASLLDFIGLQHITASLERLILFIYPTLVIFILAIFFRQRITKKQLWALIITYLGIIIAFWENVHLDGDSSLFLGTAFVLGSALTFAIYIVGSGQVIHRVGTVKYNSIAMIAAGLAVLAHHGLLYQWKLFHFPTQVYVLSLLMAIIATVLPSFMVTEGIRRIGAGNVSIISSVGPISTNILALIFLGEVLGPWQWMGTFMVIGGVLLISVKSSGKKE